MCIGKIRGLKPYYFELKILNFELEQSDKS
jgi:hypothetical protein